MPWSWSTPVGPTNGTREIDLIGATGLNLGTARRIPTTSDHDAVLVAHELPAPVVAPEPQEPAVATSQNGYTANDRSLVSSRTIPGSAVKVAVRNGPAGDLLVEWAAWFDQNIEDVDTARGGVPDDWGYAERPIRGSRFSLSNHASGTAIDLNATRHPLGKRGTFTKAQKDKANAKLQELGGALRWGENYLIRKDGMHFEVMTDEAGCRRALAILRKAPKVWQPGERNLAYRPDRDVQNGPDVVFVQKAIGMGTQDGYYGPKTAARLKAWEEQHNSRKKPPRLGADGIVGPFTWQAMGVTTKYDNGAAKK